MVQVFLSYAEEDAEHAIRLASDLRSADVNVWMAPDSIPAGESFVSAIDRGLASSDYFAVLLSPASLASNWVKTEVDAAIDRAKQGTIVLLPLSVHPVAVPPLLATFQRLDFTNYERGLAMLAERLGVQLNPGVPSRRTREGQSANDAVAHGHKPPDRFVATVRGDLERGAQRFRYLVLRATPVPESIVDTIVEVALLRVGVAIWSSQRVSRGQILAALGRELEGNPHRLAGVLAVTAGDSTSLTPYEVGRGTSGRAMVLSWNPSDGSDAIGSSIEVVVNYLTGADSRRS